MIDHYDAFISYKHGELDSKIAERVQHKLEHFHIPGKIAKRTGKKKITRIFRDKEELPITSNLTDTISYALEHSDYLIVICSTRTKLSTWVTREIKVFLETHPRNRVLTVLCDGEPGDVIPEELLYEEHEVTDDNGTVHKVKVPLEPLSCDYRMSFRKADREELPRLAAPIIGCSYDELMRRRRVYRIQRAAAVGSAVLAAAIGFGFYMYHSKKEVQRHYEEALRNRAINLAWESDRLYDEQEVVKSLQLALASLPSEEGSEIPVTFDAIRAITKATRAYTPVGEITAFLPTWNYTMPGQVTDLKLSPKRSYLVGMDVLGNLICWDTDTHKERYVSNDAINCGFYDDKTLVVLSDDKVTAVDIDKGNVIWEYEREIKYVKDGFYGDMLEFRDDSVVVVFVSPDTELITLDIKKGKEKDVHVLEKDTASYGSYSSFQLSPDGKKLAMVLRTMDSKGLIYIYNIEDNTYIKNEEEKDVIIQLFWADDDNLLYIPVSSGDYRYWSNSNRRKFEDTSVVIVDMDAVTAEDRWSADFTAFSEYYSSGEFRYLSNRDAVLFYRGNRMSVFDLKTGQELNSYECNDDFISTFLSGEDSSINFVSSEGDLGYTIEEDGKGNIVLIDSFSDDISMAAMGKGIFAVRRDGKEIIHFERGRKNDYWVDLSRDEDHPELSASFMCVRHDDKLYLTSYDSKTEDITLTVVDLNKGKITDKFDLDIPYYEYSYEAIVLDEYVYMVIEKDLMNYIVKFSLEKGKVVSEFELEKYITVREIDDKFWYVSKEEEDAVLCSFDPVSEKTKTYDLDIASGEIKNGSDLFIDEEGKNFIYETDDDKVFLFDIATEETKLLASDRNADVEFVYCNEDYGIIGDKLSVNVIPFKSNRDSYVINCERIGAVDCCEHDGAIYILYENGLLGKHNSKDGSLIKTLALFVNDFQSRTVGEGMFDVGALSIEGDTIEIMYKQDDRHEATLVDIGEFEISAVIPYYLCYHEASDRYYDLAPFYNEKTKESGYKIGYFNRYSVDELIKIAREMLDGAELSDEDKNRYGISG